MKRSTRIVKKSLALFLVVLMSINTFAAVVGDNDGAAFITKAEFDSLKNDFQSQLDRYNSSIDNKIDGAIASYLGGIKINKTGSAQSVLYKINSSKTVTFTNNWAVPVTQIGNKYEFCFRLVCNLNASATSGAIGEWTENYYFINNNVDRTSTGTTDSYLCRYEKTDSNGLKVNSNCIYKSTPFFSCVS